MIAVEGVPQAVLDHGVDHGEVAHLLAAAQIGGVRRLVMISWPPATTMSASPCAICCMPSATARRPEPQSWFRLQAVASFGMPALIAAWRAGFWPCAGRQHLAQDHLVHVLRLHPGALERGLDGDRAELMGGKAGEGAVEGADRRARGAGDDDVCHGVDLLFCCPQVGTGECVFKVKEARTFSVNAPARFPPPFLEGAELYKEGCVVSSCVSRLCAASLLFLSFSPTSSGTCSTPP